MIGKTNSPKQLRETTPITVGRGFDSFWSFFGAKRRRHAAQSKERQSALNFFWFTRNMTAAEVVDFNQNHGGLLSGAKFDKEPHWDAKMKVERMRGLLTRSEKRQMLQHFIDNPNLQPENIVFR